MTNQVDELLSPPTMDQEFLPEEATLHAKKVIEALLFATSDPLPMERIREILASFYEFKPFEVVSMLHELAKEYQDDARAFCLEEIAEGYLIRTSSDYAPYVQELFRNKKAERLSHAAREVLSIIAFKQPITRTGIEAVRGVDSSSIVQTLVEKGLVEPVGQHDSPGKPTLFGTTQVFLRHFGLKDVDQLKEMLHIPEEPPVAEEPPPAEEPPAVEEILEAEVAPGAPTELESVVEAPELEPSSLQ